jgi:hypothetical protein
LEKVRSRYFIRSAKISDPNPKDHYTEIPITHGLNRIVKNISKELHLPIEAQAALKRDKKIIIESPSGERVYIEITTKKTLPPDIDLAPISGNTLV